MEMPRRYPVGMQVFEQIRRGGYLYADKTEHIHRMAHAAGKFYFLSRPRRFGKSLLVSTMDAYFQGKRDLFEGLAIDRLEQDWLPHPVIHLDLSSVKSADEAGLAAELDMVMRRAEAIYGGEESAISWSARMESLIHAAHSTPDGSNGVVVLVDEYDAPLLNVTHDARKLQIFREVMRELYAPLKTLDPELRFVFLTGITKFSQLSIFSELNNLNNISMDAAYNDICGFSADEVDKLLDEDIEQLAEELDMDPGQCREELRRMYDGYRFSGSARTGIYNPFSLVSAFAKREIAPYWFSTGTPTSLVNLLQRNNVAIPQLEGVRAPASAFDAPSEAMGDPIAFMYQSGYLTIKAYDRRTRAYTLGIPNAEVSEGLYDSLLPIYTNSPATKTGGFIADFSSALIYENDMDKALHLLRAFLASLPYGSHPRNEQDVQTILFIIFKLVGASITTEVRVATGRLDILIDAAQAIYVVELKYRRAGTSSPTSADALTQIEDRGYAIPYQAGAKPVVKVGVCYSEEQQTIDEGWAIRR